MKKAIKLLTIVCFVAAVCAMASCKKEKSQEELIIGTWTVSSCSTDPANEFSALLKGATFTFSADKTCTASFQGMTGNGSYTIADGKLTIQDNDASDLFNQAFDIKTLTEKNLTLYAEMTDTEDGTTSTTKVTINFDKQK